MNQVIDHVILQQNPHWENVPYRHELVRIHDETALADLNLDEIQIITGIRRCGKSTLLQVLINKLIEKTNPKSILYINFDDPNYTEVCSDPRMLYGVVTTAEKLSTQPIHYIFLDEVQNVSTWEKYVKSVYDSRRFKKIFVTGSNADLLNSDYASLLSGRYIETRIYPLSYSEFLINHGIIDYVDLIRKKSSVLSIVDFMLKFGGFPRVYFIEEESQRQKILKSYYETILLNDCIKNHSIRDTKTLIQLLYYLLNNISTLYSYNSLSKAVSSNENTVQQFIHVLEDAYFISELKQYAYSLKTQSRARKKIYCIDNGLINSVTFKFSRNLGKLLENLVYSELIKLGYKDKLYFYNDQKECDFIVHREEKGSFAIQVCYHLNHENRSREINGLKAVMEKFSLPSGVIITYDDEEQIDERIQVMPFWKFFFNPDPINNLHKISD